MRTSLTLTVAAALLTGAVSAPMARDRGPVAGPSLESIGPLAFGPEGTLFVADPQAATIFAVALGSEAAGATAGTADVAGIDAKLRSPICRSRASPCRIRRR